ncbi:MAG TPA: Flp family type IVb pilin [Pseudolabrys sp.]|nr:Flp family type IVb pilin [Pseudolabrys sp.]
MHHIRAELGRFVNAQDGTTAIEYAIIASGIAVAIIAAVTGLGVSVKGMFTAIASALS